MALTDYDKKNLSSSDQKKIQEATDRWTAANAKGDTVGMQQAAADAAAIRNNAGYKTDSSGNYSGSYTTTSSGGSGSTYSQYAGVGTYNDSGLPASVKSQIEQYKVLYNNAMTNGDTAGAQAAHNAAEALRKQYGYSGGDDGSDFIALGTNTPVFNYDYETPQPTYEGKYDPQMEVLLNQILNRDDFSYDVATDPLYQQYAQMYQREGDRAMRETMAEAAAGAGGMNSYAMTAAQQANNYYSSQLNDKIPELYQLAYDKYLADIESKVQDLGLLQNMDATQYNRYLTTLDNWKDDRNFAYGLYRDDIADSQWNKQFDYNSFINDRNFAYDSDWRNKEFNFNNEWKNKEWDFNVGQTQLENERYERERAREDVWEMISLGKTPSPELVAKSGIPQSDVDLAVAAVQAEKKKVTYSDGKRTPTGGKTIGTTYQGLGLGPVADIEGLVLNLVENGIVELYEDGSVAWADGYDAHNYQKVLLDEAKKNTAKAIYPTLQF